MQSMFGDRNSYKRAAFVTNEKKRENKMDKRAYNNMLDRDFISKSTTRDRGNIDFPTPTIGRSSSSGGDSSLSGGVKRKMAFEAFDVPSPLLQARLAPWLPA